jgi:transposase-like protein
MAKGNLVTFTAFKSEDDAIAMLESLRWPNGPACPHCGGADPYRLTARTVTPGKRSARPGLWKCRACRKQFTVKVGTIFESSHIPVSKWLMAIHLICASKKGMSALQFQRMLGMTYRSAWFMAHRLRHAMAEDGTFQLDGIVEADETYVGARHKRGTKRGRPGPDSHKVPVVALVQRGGAARAFPVERITGETLKAAIQANVKPEATLMTDELPVYQKPGTHFADHQTVNHGDGEYVRGDAHVNTAEGFFALLKRGVMGTFHHISRGHMHRYCDEFAFRYTNRIACGVDDNDRAKKLVLAAEGKRLTFKQPSGASAA